MAGKRQKNEKWASKCSELKLWNSVSVWSPTLYWPRSPAFGANLRYIWFVYGICMHKMWHYYCHRMNVYANTMNRLLTIKNVFRLCEIRVVCARPIQGTDTSQWITELVCEFFFCFVFKRRVEAIRLTTNAKSNSDVWNENNLADTDVWQCAASRHDGKPPNDAPKS